MILGGDGSRGLAMRIGFWRWRRAICLGRTAVPVSAGVWESETAVHNLDGDRVRVCDDRGNEKNEGKDGRRAKEKCVRITEKCWTGKIASQISTLYSAATPGKLVDMQMRDSMNMGAAMAVAAVDTILQNFRDFNRKPSDYDRIITGDLGMVGKEILLILCARQDRIFPASIWTAGIEMFDPEDAGYPFGRERLRLLCRRRCCAAIFFRKYRRVRWKRVLFVPTGRCCPRSALMRGRNVPGIAHGWCLREKESFGE